MENNPHAVPDLSGPFSLEVAEKWLLWLEGITTLERDLGSATRIVLLNLFRHLAERGVIDGHGFVQTLLLNLDQIPKPPDRLAVQCFAEDLLRALPAPAGGAQQPVPRH